MTVGSMPAPALLALLSATGYKVCFRSAVWVECLVLRNGERWIGNGLSEDAALDDAVARMLPSHAARTLLARATAVQPDGEARAHVDQPEPVPIAEPHVDEHVTVSVEPASAATGNEATP